MSTQRRSAKLMLDDDEFLDAQVAAIRAGYAGVGAWLTELARRELRKLNGDPSPGHSVKAAKR